jgi:predicted phosphoribosyltransferase
MKKYAEGGKLPQDLVDEIARKENEEDRDLVMAPVRAGVKAGKAVAEKLKKDLTGGAFTGARLNMPSNTRLGKLSAADTRLLNKEDARKKNPYETEKESGYKKGGSVKSSASKRADGCAIKGKTKGRMV